MKQLWGVAKKKVTQQKFLSRAKTLVQKNAQFDREGEFIDEEDLKAIEEEEQIKESKKWYLIKEHKPLTQVWEITICLFTIYTIFATPYV